MEDNQYEKDDSILVVEKLERVKNIYNKAKLLFLYTGLLAPIMYSLNIFLLYKFRKSDEIFIIELMVFIGAFILTVLGSMFLYFRYKRFLSLNDEELLETSAYKHISKAYFDIIYTYYIYNIVIKNTVDTSVLVINDEIQDTVKLRQQVRFTMMGKIDDNFVLVKYKLKSGKGVYSVYLNKKQIEDKFKEVVNY